MVSVLVRLEELKIERKKLKKAIGMGGMGKTR